MNFKLKFAVIQSRRHQFDIAIEAGISEVRFSKILNGRIKPNPTEKKQIANTLNLSVEDLFEEKNISHLKEEERK